MTRSEEPDRRLSTPIYITTTPARACLPALALALALTQQIHFPSESLRPTADGAVTSPFAGLLARA